MGLSMRSRPKAADGLRVTGLEGDDRDWPIVLIDEWLEDEDLQIAIYSEKSFEVPIVLALVGLSVAEGVKEGERAKGEPEMADVSQVHQPAEEESVTKIIMSHQLSP
jgi:hypothetical protein